MPSFLPLSAALAVAAANPAPPATPADPWSFDLRYRHESVSDDAFDRDAEADTLRLRAGFKHAFGRGWTGFIEAEGVAELNDRFNSGANGQTQYPVVLDARALEVNQVWMDWRGASFGTRLGRQRIVLDNARFIGNVGWRQNEQTFDAAHLEWKPTQDLQVQGYWLGTVHRPAGDNARDPLARERKLDGRLLRTRNTLPNGALVAYGYWIEDREVRSASTRTVGLRWTAAWPLHEGWKFGTTLEAAQQAPYAAASGDNIYYGLIEPRIEYGPYAFRLGWERLGANSGRAFPACHAACLQRLGGQVPDNLGQRAGGPLCRRPGGAERGGQERHLAGRLPRFPVRSRRRLRARMGRIAGHHAETGPGAAGQVGRLPQRRLRTRHPQALVPGRVVVPMKPCIYRVATGCFRKAPGQPAAGRPLLDLGQCVPGSPYPTMVSP